MKPTSSTVQSTWLKTIAGCLGTTFATRLLPLLLLATPATVQAQFGYTTNNGTITITRYFCPGSNGAVTIPGEIGGRSVTRIGGYAFESCTNLTSVTIPDSVTSIGDFAFRYCTSLTNVTIGNSVTNLGYAVFAYCTRLTSVTIPNSVTSIPQDTFGYCTSLTEITVGAANSFYTSVDGVLFNKSTNTLIRCPEGKAGSYTIPNSVTSIGNNAFYSCASLTSVTIPDSVTSIGNHAFSSCTRLTSVMIGDSITSIGSEAFSHCTGLTSVTIPNSVTSIFPYAFYSCTNLTSVTIPDSVTSIDYAFQYCTSLTSVTIPDSVTSIDYAFQYCTSLTSVTIPDSVTSIDYAFQYCTRLTSITIGNSVASIGAYPFQSCISLTEITVGAANSFYSSVDGVLFNKSTNTLIRCPEGKAGSYSIPNSVTSVGGWAFRSCRLTSVTISDSVTSIAKYAFQYCTNLTSVTIGNGVTTIGEYAFEDCISLAGVYFRGNAPSFGNGVFYEANYSAILYYLPGTTGWDFIFAFRQNELWKPLVQTSDARFGVRTNRFGFNITWASSRTVVVEACTNLSNPIWSPLGTNTLTDGSSYFSDPRWTNYAARFYRLRSR